MDIRSGVKFQGGEGRKLELGPPKNENFPWILLDRLLAAYKQIQGRAHGRRDGEVIQTHDHLSGNVRNMTHEQRKVLSKWLASCGKGSPDRGLEPDVFRLLVEMLENA